MYSVLLLRRRNFGSIQNIYTKKNRLIGRNTKQYVRISGSTNIPVVDHQRSFPNGHFWRLHHSKVRWRVSYEYFRWWILNGSRKTKHYLLYPGPRSSTGRHSVSDVWIGMWPPTGPEVGQVGILLRDWSSPYFLVKVPEAGWSKRSG